MTAEAVPSLQPDPLTAFFPRVGRNYNAPYRVDVLTGSTYTKITLTRASILQSLTPTTVGTIFANPGVQPNDDSDAIPSTIGMVFLDAVGDWYIRHTGSGTETFRILDAGGAGNAQAAMAGLPTASDAVLIAALTPITWTTVAPITVGASDTAIAAASTTRRALSIFNSSTAGQSIAITTEGTATAANRGIAILAAGQGIIFGPFDACTRQAIRAFGSAAAGSISSATGV